MASCLADTNSTILLCDALLPAILSNYPYCYSANERGFPSATSGGGTQFSLV